MSADAPESLRAHAAWSLGRLEDASGTEILARSLAIIEGELAPAYVFDALWAKQEQIFADAELQADLAEGLNAHSARRAGVLSPSARALQNRVATLPVSVRVLDRAIGSWLDRPDPHRAAALSRAIDTVLRRFDEAFEERKRRPDDAWVEVREAVFFLQRAALVGGPSARRQVWSEIGARSREAIIARAVAEAFYGAEAPVPGRPTHAPLASDRFVGAWLAERVLLTRPSVRAALETDILLWESSPEVFMLLAALGRAREIDLVRELAP